ncbi:MAG: biopolymer transporter ExbD [Thermoguttaceae bacterium]|jgi:biopolymer transport protein ExbD
MPLKTQLDEQPPLNLTAMLDVMFLLIIFFVLNTRFLDEERQIGLELPRVADRGVLAAAAQSKTVNVYRDGTVTLDQAPVTLAELTARLASAKTRSPSLSILVRGDGQGEFQQVAAVLSACKQAGIDDLGISVRLGP